MIWDVTRLIRLVEGFPEIAIPLDEIKELDECFWFAEGTSPATVRQVSEHARLIEQADLSHPIILSSDGRVMGGMHRVAKAYLLGHATISAVRFEQDPEPDYHDRDLDTLPY